MSEEHINSTESHYAGECPGEGCASHDGLRRLLAQLEAGTHRFVRANGSAVPL